MKSYQQMKSMNHSIAKNKRMVEAIDLMSQSLYKADAEIRAEAIESDCFSELMHVRDAVQKVLREERIRYQ